MNLPNSTQPNIHAVNPSALSAEEAAKLLSAAGGKPITVEQIHADVEAGAPVSANGKIHLVAYAAWLLREVQSK